MDQTVFRSKNSSFILRLETGKRVAFVKSFYSTSDAEEIELIKKTNAYRRKDVFDITEGDKSGFPVTKQKVIRGVVTSKDLDDEKGIKEKTQESFTLQEKPMSMCPECPAMFENDFSGRKLKAHMLSHRPEIRRGRKAKQDETSGNQSGN